jgi:hypothetical protein
MSENLRRPWPRGLHDKVRLKEAVGAIWAGTDMNQRAPSSRGTAMGQRISEAATPPLWQASAGCLLWWAAWPSLGSLVSWNSLLCSWESVRRNWTVYALGFTFFRNSLTWGFCESVLRIKQVGKWGSTMRKGGRPSKRAGEINTEFLWKWFIRKHL